MTARRRWTKTVTFYSLMILLFVQEGKTIPRICDEILKWRDTWLEKTHTLQTSEEHTTTSSAEATCPVMTYNQFQDHVREIDPIAKTEFIRIACNYLQDMGEVRNSNIALDTQIFLCSYSYD